MSETLSTLNGKTDLKWSFNKVTCMPSANGKNYKYSVSNDFGRWRIFKTIPFFGTETIEFDRLDQLINKINEYEGL